GGGGRLTGVRGTVFTLAVPTDLPTTTTASLSPLRAQASSGQNLTTDVKTAGDPPGAGGSLASFASNTQLTLVLRVSQESELIGTRTAVAAPALDVLVGDSIRQAGAEEALAHWMGH